MCRRTVNESFSPTLQSQQKVAHSVLTALHLLLGKPFSFSMEVFKESLAGRYV